MVTMYSLKAPQQFVCHSSTCDAMREFWKYYNCWDTIAGFGPTESQIFMESDSQGIGCNFRWCYLNMLIIYNNVTIVISTCALLKNLKFIFWVKYSGCPNLEKGVYFGPDTIFIYLHETLISWNNVRVKLMFNFGNYQWISFLL